MKNAFVFTNDKHLLKPWYMVLEGNPSRMKEPQIDLFGTALDLIKCLKKIK